MLNYKRKREQDSKPGLCKRKREEDSNAGLVELSPRTKPSNENGLASNDGSTNSSLTKYARIERFMSSRILKTQFSLWDSK